MNDPNITDWLTVCGTCLIPILIAAVPAIYWWHTNPFLKLQTDTACPRKEETYLRLKVTNQGAKTAKKSVGRLIRITDEHTTDIEGFPQLNFCWERHNQANPPHPIDIPKGPFVAHLDIAKYSTEDPQVITFRVDADNQQLAVGDYNSEFRLLSVPVKTYYVLVSVYTEDGFTSTRWYALDWTGSNYTINERRPPNVRGNGLRSFFRL